MSLAVEALRALAAAGLTIACSVTPAATVDFGDVDASADARRLAQWIGDTGDNRGMPFAIVDKKGAMLYAFDDAGRLAGATPALLGQAVGDTSAPGIGRRPLAEIRPHERTSPAGRFVSEPGRNLDGEHVVWVEYDTGFAIHRLRAGGSERQRARRLASATPQDNRASYGCVVVPVAFYESVVQRVLGQGHGVVYVLPDSLPLQALFGADALVAADL